MVIMAISDHIDPNKTFFEKSLIFEIAFIKVILK